MALGTDELGPNSDLRWRPIIMSGLRLIATERRASHEVGRVHGHTRAGEIEHGISDKTATVVEHLGRVAGYATNIGFFFHAVSETNDGMKTLIGAANEITGPGILLPTLNHDLFR